MKASPFTERGQELSPSSSGAAGRDVEQGHEDSGLLGQMSPRARAAAFRRTGSTTEVGCAGDDGMASLCKIADRAQLLLGPHASDSGLAHLSDTRCRRRSRYSAPTFRGDSWAAGESPTRLRRVSDEMDQPAVHGLA